MGASYQFQFVSSKLNDTSPVKRVLPQTPGQPTNEKPPSKPPRHHVTKAADTETVDAGSDTSYSYCGSIDLEQSTIDEGKRSRLKRIAKEIASRSSGYQDRKPPPVSCIFASHLHREPLEVWLVEGYYYNLVFGISLVTNPFPLFDHTTPPPLQQPYEQVGNSIGYQLLHQNHKDVTAKLIDVLYPALKVSDLFDVVPQTEKPCGIPFDANCRSWS